MCNLVCVNLKVVTCNNQLWSDSHPTRFIARLLKTPLHVLIALLIKLFESQSYISKYNTAVACLNKQNRVTP